METRGKKDIGLLQIMLIIVLLMSVFVIGIDIYNRMYKKETVDNKPIENEVLQFELLEEQKNEIKLELENDTEKQNENEIEKEDEKQNESKLEIKNEDQKQNVNLTEDYKAEGLQLSIKYPSDWEISEESSIYLKFKNKSDEQAHIGIYTEWYAEWYEDLYEGKGDLKKYINGYGNPEVSGTVQDEGYATVLGYKGYYKKMHMATGNKLYIIGIVKDGRIYKFMYDTIEENYQKYEDVFTSMIASVEFLPVNEEFSYDEARDTFTNYKDFIVMTSTGSRIEFLYQLGLINNKKEDELEKINIDGLEYVNTGISYNTFKKAMLNLVSEYWFEEIGIGPSSFIGRNYLNKNGNLYCLASNLDCSGTLWDIDKVHDISGNNYQASLWSEQGINVYFSVGEYNGKCVITYCDAINGEWGIQ